MEIACSVRIEACTFCLSGRFRAGRLRRSRRRLHAVAELILAVEVLLLQPAQADDFGIDRFLDNERIARGDGFSPRHITCAMKPSLLSARALEQFLRAEKERR